MQYQSNPWTMAQQRLTPQELAFLDDHTQDRDLMRARWELLYLAREHGLGMDAARGALFDAYIRLEARRIACDAARLQTLLAYLTRTDIPADETDYMSMSPEEFRMCEQRLRARTRGVSPYGPVNL